MTKCVNKVKMNKFVDCTKNIIINLVTIDS